MFHSIIRNTLLKLQKKESRKKRVLSDSDEEIFPSKKKKPANETKNKNKSPKPVLKEVKAVDIFGSGPIKRTEPIVKKVKKNTETGIHSDDDFDNSLLQLDAVEESALKSEDAPSSSNVSNNKSSKQTEEVKGKSPAKNKNSKDQDKSHKLSTVVNETNEVTEAKTKSPQKYKDKKEIKETQTSKKASKGESKSRLDSKISNEKKRQFAEFIENGPENVVEKSDEDTKNKKKKLDKSVSEITNQANDVKNEVHSDDSDATIIEDSQMDHSIQSTKKKKFNKSLNESGEYT